MFKKNSLIKTWKVLSTVSSVFLIYRQVKALYDLSEEAQDYLAEEDMQKILNPVQVPPAQIEQVQNGV